MRVRRLRLVIDYILATYLEPTWGIAPARAEKSRCKGCWRVEVRKGIAQNVVTVGQPQAGLHGAVQRLNKAYICSQGLQPACTLRLARNACGAGMEL